MDFKIRKRLGNVETWEPGEAEILESKANCPRNGCSIFLSPSLQVSKSPNLRPSSAFVLMEIMLALTIFSISVLGLVSALNDTLNVSNTLHRAQVVRAGLESILSEARQREEVEDMKLESVDANKGIAYRTEVEEVRLPNENGEDLDNMYVLRAIATYQENGQERQDKAEVYVNLSKAAETTAEPAPDAAAGTYGNTNAAQAGNNANTGGNRNNRGGNNGANGGNRNNGANGAVNGNRNNGGANRGGNAGGGRGNNANGGNTGFRGNRGGGNGGNGNRGAITQ